MSSPILARRGTSSRRRSLSLQRPKKNNSKNNDNANAMLYVVCMGVVIILGLWFCIMFIFPWPPHPPSSPKHSGIRRGNANNIGGMPSSSSIRNNNNQHKTMVTTTSSHNNNDNDNQHSRYQPRVVGLYAYQTSSLSNWKEGRTKLINLPPYIYLTERLNPYLTSYSPQPFRRLRNHNYYHHEDASLSDVVYNYNLAIAGATSYYNHEDDEDDVEPPSTSSKAMLLLPEDPLSNLWLTSASRDTFRSINNDSEDYEDAMAEPLEDEECEATPKNRQWMLHSFPTCNFVHEFDFTTALRRNKSKLLGHGYWRDVWPVLDTEPLISAYHHEQRKAVLKTIRYEHDYDERNFHRHIRDASVSERLTSSPLVTSIYSFCGHSGFFEFAPDGSLADRLEKHWMAKMDLEGESEEHPDKAREDVKNNPDLLDQRTKLELAHQVAAGLADFHDAYGMKDENGNIISAAIVHADITTDQFVNVDGIFKINDFNRCRFMRRYRNSATTNGSGDGKPCGFYVQNNPAKNRSPEEYAYTVETEKIDIYSMGNIFYTILTDQEPWEEVSEKKAQAAVVKGERPEVPQIIKDSSDPVDKAIRNVMYKCWKHTPSDRPRAREVADYLAKQLSELNVGMQR